MCELFGISSQNACAVNDYLLEFYSHSVRHPHGWGLAELDGNIPSIEKESLQASKSNYLKERLSVPVRVKHALAHIRYATIGNIAYQNCHPYVRQDRSGRYWTFIHNGTVFDYPALNRYLNLQTGDTDSERILMYLTDQIDDRERREGRVLNSWERFCTLDTLISDMAAGNKLNLIFYDGQILYVHTNYKDSLHYLRKNEQIIFSTAPLTDEDWKLVPFTRLLAFRDGKLIFEGTKHGNEYIEKEEDLKSLYQIYSDL